MQRIIAEGIDIGEWATSPIDNIDNINKIYIVAEDQYTIGVQMYKINNLVEAFVLLMRFTILYDRIYSYKNLIDEQKKLRSLNLNLAGKTGEIICLLLF